MNDIECPYCEHSFDICKDDGHGYDESITHEQECPSCEKRFVFTTSILWCYTPEKADCLNGSEHKFKPTHTVPRKYTKMRCEDCDKTRPCNEEEKLLLGYWK